MIDFSTLQGLAIPEGVVTQIEDASGRVIWAMASDNEPSAIFEVAKQTFTSYAAETTYSDNEAIVFDIYPKKDGTVKVTYGGVTKTIKDTSGAEEPNAIQVFFGKFNGEVDDVTTPASGTLTIEGAYRGYGAGVFTTQSGKSDNAAWNCITKVIDFGKPSFIGRETFYQCTDTTLVVPEGVTHIGKMAFSNSYVTSLTLPSTLKEVGLKLAWATNLESEPMKKVYMLSTTPPAWDGITDSVNKAFNFINDYGTIVVPKGCGQAYKTAENWSEFADQIVEVS